MQYQHENSKGSCEYRCGVHDCFYVEPHLHEYSEILYCSAGAAKIYINSREVTIPAGHMVFIPPNYIHEFRCDCPVTCAVFSNDLISLFFRELGKRSIEINPINLSHIPDFSEKLFFHFPVHLLLKSAVFSVRYAIQS